MRRVFYLALGATVGVVAVRRASALVNRWTPEGVAGQLGGTGERIAEWWAEVQAHAAQREHELRDALGLDADVDTEGSGNRRSEPVR